MSIYPKGMDPSSLIYKWEIAALDIPVPTELTDTKDQAEWNNYLDCLSPAQKLRKYGQAMDVLHKLHDAASAPELRSDEEKNSLYSAWKAASIANYSLWKSFNFETEHRHQTGGYRSDVLNGLDCIIDFLKSVNSADTKIWEGRLRRHQKIDKQVFQKIVKNVPNDRPKPKPVGPSA